MKKLLSALLALTMVLSLAACSGGNGEDAGEDGDKEEEKSWRDLMEEGEDLLEDEEYDDAIDVLSDAIDLRDTRADLYVLRGRAYLGKGDSSSLKRAVKDFEAALEINEVSKEAWTGLVETLMAQEEYEEAAKRAREGLETLDGNRDLEALLEEIERRQSGAPEDTSGGVLPTEPAETEPPQPTETEPPQPQHVHSWLDANYQQPRRCAECGETDGAPLTPDFVVYNINCDMQVGLVYDYTIHCYEDTSYLTTGSLTVLEYTIIDSDETHPHRDGYEWRIARMRAQFYDENAQYYGYSPRTCQEDYYNIDLADNSLVTQGDGTTHNILYNGDIMDVFVRSEVPQNSWGDNGVATVIWVVSAQVPIGYDGFVWGFHRSAEDYAAGHIYNAYDPALWHLFRFA